MSKSCKTQATKHKYEKKVKEIKEIQLTLEKLYFYLRKIYLEKIFVSYIFIEKQLPF